MTAHFSNLRQRRGYLRLFTLVTSFVGLVLCITAISIHSIDSFVGYEASFTSLISLTTFVWTLAWSISAIFVLLFHGPYPNGVDIGLDFIGWGLGWGMGIWLLTWAAEMNYPDSCSYMSTSNTHCINARALMGAEVVSSLMAIFYGTAHLALFVMAIRAVMNGHRSKKQQRKMGDELEDGQRLANHAWA